VLYPLPEILLLVLAATRFRCRGCGKQFNERSDGVLNRASLPSDIIAFVVFCRLRYRLTLRDLSEIMLLRGFTVSHGFRQDSRRLQSQVITLRCS
jgi:transposase-like protein